MEAYKVHVDYILAGGVAETAYILSKEGAVCGSSLGIDKLPSYEFDLEDEKGATQKIVIDERVSLLDALAHQGVCNQPGGLRIYNQKYYPVHPDPEKQSYYYKKSKGGACIALTANFIAIGTWSSEVKMQNGQPQNAGELNKRVETWAADMKKQGS